MQPLLLVMIVVVVGVVVVVVVTMVVDSILPKDDETNHACQDESLYETNHHDSRTTGTHD